MMDLFFIIHKTNALLKATGWSDLHLSVNVNEKEMKIKITAHLNDEVINTTSLPYNIIYDTTLTTHNKLIVRLHDFAIMSYDIYKEAHKC